MSHKNSTVVTTQSIPVINTSTPKKPHVVSTTAKGAVQAPSQKSSMKKSISSSDLAHPPQLNPNVGPPRPKSGGAQPGGPRKKGKNQAPRNTGSLVRTKAGFVIPREASSIRLYDPSDPTAHLVGGPFNQMGKKMGSHAGEFLNTGAKALGSYAGSYLDKITGMGAYTVKQNTVLSNGPPVFNGQDFTEIAHREFVADVFSSTAFNLSSYPINPGLSLTLPWGSTVARAYQEWEFAGAVFEFISLSATAIGSTNTALGVVIMSTNYDALDPLYSNKNEMESCQYTVATCPDSSAIHPIECEPKLNVLGAQYVREGTPPLGSDIRMYDQGNFQIATVGMQQANVLIGELWISYRLRLRLPVLNVDAGNKFTHIRSDAGGIQSLSDPYFGMVPGPYDTMSIDVNSSANTLIFPDLPGTFFVCQYVYNNNVASQSIGTAPTPIFGATIENNQFHRDGQAGAFSSQFSMTKLATAVTYPRNFNSINALHESFLLTTTGPGQGVKFGVWAATANALNLFAVDFLIVRVDNTILNRPLAEDKTPQRRLEDLEALVKELRARSDACGDSTASECGENGSISSDWVAHQERINPPDGREPRERKR